jgi:hypothetical protein
MPEYRVYCINQNNRVVSRHYFEAPDDSAALEKAGEFCRKFEVGAWQGARLIGRLAKDGTISPHPDSLSSP